MKIDLPMKILILILLSIPVFGQTYPWTLKEKQERNRAWQDSTAWNYNMLKEDLMHKQASQGNMDYGVFPVPYYKQGLGTGGGMEEDYGGKKLFWHFFFSEKNEVNRAYLGERNSEVFFVIVTLTDTLSFAHGSSTVTSTVISRSYQVAAGAVKTKLQAIEYLAFLIAGSTPW